MKRRSFLKALFGLPLLSFPSLLWAKPKIAWYGVMGHGVVNQDYYAIVHPSAEAMWRNLSARSEWKERWRLYRASLRTGAPQRSPKELMASWEPFKFDTTGEVGRYENIRFITSENL